MKKDNIDRPDASASFLAQFLLQMPTEPKQQIKWEVIYFKTDSSCTELANSLTSVFFFPPVAFKKSKIKAAELIWLE